MYLCMGDNDGTDNLRGLHVFWRCISGADSHYSLTHQHETHQSLDRLRFCFFRSPFLAAAAIAR